MLDEDNKKLFIVQCFASQSAALRPRLATFSVQSSHVVRWMGSAQLLLMLYNSVLSSEGAIVTQQLKQLSHMMLPFAGIHGEDL